VLRVCDDFPGFFRAPQTPTTALKWAQEWRAHTHTSGEDLLFSETLVCYHLGMTVHHPQASLEVATRVCGWMQPNRV